MGEWKEYKLGDLGTIITGKTPSAKNPEDWGNEMLFVTPTDYCNYRKYSDDSIRNLSNIGIKRLKNKILPPSSILVTCIGSDMGKVVMTKSYCITNQQINSIIPNNLVNPDFLYYTLISSYDTLRVLGGDGTAVPIINKNDFSNISINIPSLPEQKRIASILGSLDDKIDLLHHENETLEAMAETLFRKWFIEDAKDEWEEKSLAYVSDITAGGDKPKIFSKYITSECTIPVYSNGIDNEGLYGYTNIPKIYKESITVSARGTIGYVVLRRSPYVPIVRLISLIPKDNIVTAKWLYLYLKQLNINGTGTTQQQLTIPDFCSRTIILPPFEIIKKFTNIIDNLYDKQLINKEDISCIEKMKNCLLKKLMHNK